MSSISSKRVLALYIATGKYVNFFEGFYKSYMENFLPESQKSVLIFTDNIEHIERVSSNLTNVEIVYTEHLSWPLGTLLRFHRFLSQKEFIETFDLVYFFNANAEIRKPIFEEVIPTDNQVLTVVRSPGYTKSQIKTIDDYQYCRNPHSKAYIPFGEGVQYLMGGFNGGASENFLKMSEIIANWIDHDLKSNIIPVWHDESYINRYVLDLGMENVNLLTPEYGSDQPTMLPMYDPYLWYRDKEVLKIESEKFSPIKLLFNN